LTQQRNLPHYAIPLLHLPASLGGIGIRDPISATIPAYITTITRTLRYAKHGITRTNGHTLQLPTLHQHALQHAQYEQILEHYAPTFLPIINHKDKTNYTLPDFIQNASLHGMQRYFYHTYQQSVKQNFHLHSPPDIHPYLPSLLSPLTSIPLASMS
jgi:hypothetical protein